MARHMIHSRRAQCCLVFLNYYYQKLNVSTDVLMYIYSSNIKGLCFRKFRNNEFYNSKFTNKLSHKIYTKEEEYAKRTDPSHHYALIYYGSCMCIKLSSANVVTYALINLQRHSNMLRHCVIWMCLCHHHFTTNKKKTWLKNWFVLNYNLIVN